MRHGAAETLERHCHDHPFLSLILAGGYVEAGDEGRRRVGPGDVLVHHAFESHVDRFDPRGAEVLILPLAEGAADRALAAGRIADPDVVARLAERDPAAAARRLLADLVPVAAPVQDWPDRLAADLRALAPLEMGRWASAHGLRPETVSRGFRQAYGVSPKAYRATVRARAAHAALRDRGRGLPAVAADLGFADQAHMTRAVSALTGAPPTAWRAPAA